MKNFWEVHYNSYFWGKLRPIEELCVISAKKGKVIKEFYKYNSMDNVITKIELLKVERQKND